MQMIVLGNFTDVSTKLNTYPLIPKLNIIHIEIFKGLNKFNKEINITTITTYYTQNNTF